MPILKHLIEVYFSNSHNQPYSFFHESTLRQRIITDEVPQYLLLAIAATSVRYSMHDFFKQHQNAAAKAYARASWLILLERFFATDQSPDVTMAQATAILAVIDYTAGHHRLGWVKVGLAIRLVQDLKLSAEPDPALPIWQKEETRRVFWSMYILDKFFACSRTRPVSILDADCTVALPCEEEAFREGTQAASMPTLAIMRDPFDFASRIRLGSFPVLIMMCSLLSRSMRSILQDGRITVPCWDCRSDFAETSSILMSFESMHTSGEADLKAYIKDSFGTYEGFDRQKVGHFVWARGMYHLCGLMLYHPLTLYRHRLAYGQGFPTTFAREIMSRCQNHLTRLTDLLSMVLSTGCCARGSFLGYMAAQAAIAHKLFSHSLDQDVATRSHTSLVTCTQFLIQPPVCWASYNTMAAAVNDYDIEPDLAQCLIDVASPPMLELKSTQMDRLRGIVDYAWLSDSDRAKFLGGTPAFNFDASVGDWPTQFGFDDPSSFFMVPSDEGNAGFDFTSTGDSMYGVYSGR
ncbi:hypothetical protein LTR10_001311 [Elasticomyces elasticus]|nr:hypothetical protein LTR10_001311 [Elasticomyces elasticus]KAK4965324.1 hypothetical protein LTR42_012078 [Elasticomyces elasticus]